MTGLADGAKNEHGDDRHLPGEPGIWLMVLADLAVFSAFFITFMVYRAQHLAVFEMSRQSMPRGYGLLNTLLLLSSSWLVARAVGAARIGRPEVGKRFVIGAIALGIAFVISKIFEYHGKISAGLTLNTNQFFIFYYMLTGIHLLHVLIGIGVLCFMTAVLSKSKMASSDLSAVESGATFWHLVDLLWVVLFALLYLVS